MIEGNDKVYIAVTGTAWMGGGTGSIEATLERLFREAQHTILMTAYAMSNGADLLFTWIESALARGIEIQIVINKFYEQPSDVQSRLSTFVQGYSYCHIYTFHNDGDLHAKTFVFDNTISVVGSSNLSRRGLLLNHELVVVLEGSQTQTVATSIRRLIESRYVTKLAL